MATTENPHATAGGSAPRAGELLRLIVESAADFAILATDPKGYVTSWNSGAERLLGYTETEILGKSADIIFTPEDRAAGAPEQERHQALTQGRAIDERWTMRKDGSLFWASGEMMPLRDPSIGFAKIFRDRTEQHTAGRRLKESEERFRLLATSIPQLVFRTRPDGDRTWGSPQWVSFTGLSLEDSLGYGWMDAVHPDDRDYTLSAWNDARSLGSYYVEHRVKRVTDGQYRWHQTRARPVKDGDAADWIGTMTDIHELRTMKDRQQVLLAELQHRTRNLMAVIQAIARKTQRSTTSMETFRVEFESRLGALSRVQSLLAEADNNRVDLRNMVTVELAAHGTAEMDEKVLIDGPPATLPASSAQTIGLALHELATNAVKYGALRQSGARLYVRWTEIAKTEGRYLVLTWTEQGVALDTCTTPVRKGYGRELIERALPYQLGAKTKLKFGSDGVRCEISVPMRQDETEHDDG
jgi:PAS domain S-box-containing protein